jgi:trehalose 6-phosphate phosphatase
MSRSNLSVHTLEDWIGLIGDVYASGKHVLLILDYDGTLTPIVDDPARAFLSPATSGVILSLRALAGIRLGVISGRALEDVRDRVGMDGVLYAGSGGLEMDLAGVRKTFPVLNAITDLMDGIRRRLVPVVESFSGAWIEKKPGCLSIHLRALDGVASAELALRVEEILSLLPEVRFRTVSKAIEVTPAKGWHKGTAVEAMLRFFGEGGKTMLFPVYFGDAANDTEGMVAVLDAGGVAVGVGSDAPAVAQHAVEDSDCLRRQLNLLLRVLEQRSNQHRQAASLVNKSGNEQLPPDREKSILIVDSDVSHGHQLAEALRAEGWKVHLCCVRSRQAMTEVVGLPLNEHTLVLVDYMLPGFLASKFLAKVRTEHPDVLGVGMVEARQGRFRQPWPGGSGNAVLTKPVRPSTLIALAYPAHSGRQAGKGEKNNAPV